MNSITTSMTAQAPSRFGMPIDGSAFGKQCATTGAAAIAEDADVAVVVDVLSFTTTVCVAL